MEDYENREDNQDSGPIATCSSALSVGLHALAHGWLGLRSLLGAAHILGVSSLVPDGRLTHGWGLLLGRRHKFA